MSNKRMIGEPCDPERAEPLRVTARLAEGVVLRHPLILDGLLAWAVTSAEQSLPPVSGREPEPVAIPVALEPRERFHLCSEGFATVEARELRYKQRRAPVMQYARLGNAKITRVDIAAGANKGLRIPYELQLLAGGTIEWWCVGDRERIMGLLSCVHYLGKYRASGKGRLDLHGTPWTVEPCETWDGFPLLRDGRPLRHLPLDWPGLGEHSQQLRPLSFPYFDHTREELCACP